MLDTPKDVASSEPTTAPNERVDLPQSYGSWREYAFSEYPEHQNNT